jgi:hypothetical protein
MTGSVKLTRGKLMAVSKKDGGKAGTAKSKTTRPATAPAKKKATKKG